MLTSSGRPHRGGSSSVQCRRGRGKRTSQPHTPGTACPVLCFASLDLVPRGGPLRNPEKLADSASVHCCSLCPSISGGSLLLLRPSLLSRQPEGKGAPGSPPLPCVGAFFSPQEPVILGTDGPEAVGDRKCSGCSCRDKSRDKLLFQAHLFVERTTNGNNEKHWALGVLTTGVLN